MSFLDLVDGIGIVVSNTPISTVTVVLHAGGTYEVTGISPQSSTVAQLSNGFASRGTLYPPLNRTLREPLRWRYRKLDVVCTYYRLRRREPCLIPLGPNRAPGLYDVPVSNGAPVYRINKSRCFATVEGSPDRLAYL